MTIGQRIAQKRKERGLSQEALGEALGASRQSVYKWESDNALPEIDKLVTMSKLFGVTIGWLLGVEEQAGTAETSEEASDPPPESGEAELTETQLKMVEEIVDRYLSARQPAKKKRWPWAAGVAVGLVLLAALSSLRSDLQRMRNDYSNLQISINSVSRNVDNQIGSITNRVEEVLKSQNSLMVSYGTEVISGDLAANTVTFSAYAVPKTYIDGMTAVFLADNGKEIVQIPSEIGAGQTFSAELACTITDDITISIVLVSGEVQETQLLEQYLALYSNSLPDIVWPEAGPLMTTGWKAMVETGELGWLNTQGYAWFPNVSAASSVSAYDFGRAELRSVRVGLFRNRVLLGWLEPLEDYERPKDFTDSNIHEFFAFPDLSVKPEAGDEFRLCTVGEDEYGREFVCQGPPYVLDSSGRQLVMGGSGETGMDDPANWTY